MHSLSPRQRRRQATLRAILDAALGLVVEGGFDALSMQRLANEVDLTPGALYRYYPGKDAIIDALTERVVLSFGEVVGQVRAALCDEPELVQIVAMLTAYRQIARQAPHRFALISLLMAEPRVLLPDATASSPAFLSVMQALTPLIACFEAAARAGELSDGAAADRAIVAFAAVHGLLQLRKQERHLSMVLNIDRLADEAVCTLLSGWGACRDQPANAVQRCATRGDLIALAGGLA